MGWQIHQSATYGTILKWSFLYDSLVISVLSLPLFFLFLFFKSQRWVAKIIIVVFSLTFAFMVSLNIADIFYFPFSLKRADIELFYVIRNPFKDGISHYLLVTVLIIVGFLLIVILFYRWISNLRRKSDNRHCLVVLTSLLGLFVISFSAGRVKRLLPNYPLIQLSSAQLPLAQNSFHRFAYSLFRGNDIRIGIPDYKKEYRDISEFPVLRKNNSNPTGSGRRNIVVFIMESTPYDFFDENSPYKVEMPFLDSLAAHSVFFKKAFSYSLQSNKGITAILGGTPTLTEVPLYNSGYVNLPMTHVGKILDSMGYNSSFFIGDNYDDFGFAQCANWIGIQNYYSMEDIPGYKHLEKHTMGLQDEYVLNFMGDRIKNFSNPFFAVHYNISTHYPYDLPSGFRDPFSKNNKTPAMQAMNYYSSCLQNFFNKVQKENWFKNTVFIFCSDHWMFPDFKTNSRIDPEASFRVALFVYDPLNPQGRTVSTPVSQFDILNTILYFSGYKNEFISYGQNLMDSAREENRVVFARKNDVIYQAFDRSYVLGFNTGTGKPEYCYNYILDQKRENNLINNPDDGNVNRLRKELVSFLSAAYNQYNRPERFAKKEPASVN